jgi:hypothetical protein
VNRDEATRRANLARDTQALLSEGMEAICELEVAAGALAAIDGHGLRGQLKIERHPNGAPFMTAIFEPAVDVAVGETQWLPGAVRPLDL